MGKPVPINSFIKITLLGILLLAAGWIVVHPRVADTRESITVSGTYYYRHSN